MDTALSFTAGDEVRPATVRIEPHHCIGPAGRQMLFGGMGMALASRAIELRLGQAPSWLTLQFLAPSPLGATLELAAEQVVGGQVAQIAVQGLIEGRPVFRGVGAIGSRPGGPDAQAARTPKAPPPQSCPVILAHADADRDAHQLLEMRLASGRFGIFSKAPIAEDGHVRAWMRPRRGAVDAATLALMADFLPATSANALGVRAGGASLDNTLRIVRTTTASWVLCDYFISAIQDGIGHGSAELFAEDGTLLALASQSYVLRLLPQRNRDAEPSQ